MIVVTSSVAAFGSIGFEGPAALLCEKTDSIATAVIVRDGFNYSQRFGTVLRKHRGVTPSDCRRERLS